VGDTHALIVDNAHTDVALVREIDERAGCEIGKQDERGLIEQVERIKNLDLNRSRWRVVRFGFGGGLVVGFVARRRRLSGFFHDLSYAAYWMIE